MRIGCFTDEISQDLREAIELMKEFDIKEAELRSFWGRNLLEMEEEDLHRARKMLEEEGIRVSCIASPLFKCNLFGEEIPKGDLHLASPRPLEEQWAILRRSIELAKFFEAPIVRTFSFWRVVEPSEEIFRKIAPLLEKASEEVAKAGLTLALENEHSCFAGSGGETAQLLALLNSSNLGVIWDPGNAFFTGETPYPDGYEKVKARIVHVHIKDARRNPSTNEPEWALIGEGEIDFPSQIKALKRDGFSGVLSLETHVAIPSSKEASRLSLQRLSALMKEVVE